MCPRELTGLCPFVGWRASVRPHCDQRPREEPPSSSRGLFRWRLLAGTAVPPILPGCLPGIVPRPIMAGSIRPAWGEPAMSHSRTTRRVFLGGMALGSSAALAARARWLRADDSPAATVGLAIMGVNGRGNALAKHFATLPGCRVLTVCDPDQRVLDRVVAQWPAELGAAPRAERDVRRALDDAAVDALVIAAPDHWHAPAAIWAAAASKHAYVEKPACHNPTEGELMMAAARRSGRVMQLGTQRRSSPELRGALGELWAGRIGRVLFGRGWINSRRPSIGHGSETAVPSGLDFDLWQGPAPERPYRDNLVHYHWHWFWHWGTGELGNNGVHALDVLRWALRVDYPERVTCGGGRRHFDDDQETPDTQVATFDFAESTLVWEHRTWHPRGIENWEYGCALEGEDGTLLVSDAEIHWLDARGKPTATGPLTSGEREHLTGFLAAIRGDGPPPAEIAEGVKSTLLCHLGNIAYRTGQAVRLDSATGRLAADTDAAVAALWTREYRPGWEPLVG